MYPNSFDLERKIRFQIPAAESVTLKVFDLRAREVATLLNRTLQQGSYQVDFIAGNLPSRVYLYQIQGGKTRDAKRMVLLK